MPQKLDIIRRYAPALLLSKLARDPGRLREPQAESFPAAVLFADISGFTALTERLTRNNPAGVTELTGLLEIYIGKLVDLITAHGGDVVKFAGDALFAVWKVTPDLTLPIETHRAVQCGVIIQQKLHNLKVASGISLALRVGLGAGRIHTLYVGGTFDRWELIVAGDPMNQVGVAGKLAQPGQAVISPQVRRLLEEVGAGTRSKDRFLFRPHPDTANLRPLIRSPLDPTAEPTLRSYIPRAILAGLDEGSDAWNADLRRVSVLFMNVRGFGYTESTPVGDIQRIMQIMQNCLYRHEGSINRFGIDDKGAILLAAFGLPPLDHKDDPLRALLAARDLRAELKAIGLESNVGIATGRAFCGSVGNEIRSEYTMHGINVNLAARLMQAAETILCDENTYEATRSEIQFVDMDPIHVKGRDDPVRVYHPTDV